MITQDAVGWQGRRRCGLRVYSVGNEPLITQHVFYNDGNDWGQVYWCVFWGTGRHLLLSDPQSFPVLVKDYLGSDCLNKWKCSPL